MSKAFENTSKEMYCFISNENLRENKWKLISEKHLMIFSQK